MVGGLFVFSELSGVGGSVCVCGGRAHRVNVGRC